MTEQRDASPFRVVQSEDGSRQFTFDVVAERVVRQQKRALFGGFEILCDEGAGIGGDNTAPPPLAYFAAAVGF
ncbi:MAG: hypothetical protein ACRDJ9_01875 [Dehalococcoidia bacterium]